MTTRRRDWKKIRSTHADVLVSLEQVIARHPANPRPTRDVAASDDHAVTADDVTAPAGSEAVVLPFPPRLVLVHGSGGHASGGHGSGGHESDPSPFTPLDVA